MMKMETETETEEKLKEDITSAMKIERERRSEQAINLFSMYIHSFIQS